MLDQVVVYVLKVILCGRDSRLLVLIFFRFFSDVVIMMNKGVR